MMISTIIMMGPEKQGPWLWIDSFISSPVSRWLHALSHSIYFCTISPELLPYFPSNPRSLSRSPCSIPPTQPHMVNVSVSTCTLSPYYLNIRWTVDLDCIIPTTPVLHGVIPPLLTFAVFLVAFLILVTLKFVLTCKKRVCSVPSKWNTAT